MKIHSNSTLLMIGDSITDCGRVRPVGESVGGDLGNGYVSLIHATLSATCPQLHIRIRNTGISGNTVRDLAAPLATRYPGLEARLGLYHDRH